MKAVKELSALITLAWVRLLPGHLDALDEEGRRLPPLQGDLVRGVRGLVLLHLGEVELEARVDATVGARERDVSDVEVDALHQALVRVERRLVVPAEPELRHVQPVLLDGPGHRHVALDVHAAHDHVGAGLLHALHVGGHGGTRVVDLEVGIAHLVPGGRQGVLLRLARGGRRRHAIGDEGDGGRLLRLTGHVGDLRRGGRVVLHRAPAANRLAPASSSRSRCSRRWGCPTRRRGWARRRRWPRRSRRRRGPG